MGHRRPDFHLIPMIAGPIDHRSPLDIESSGAVGLGLVDAAVEGGAVGEHGAVAGGRRSVSLHSLTASMVMNSMSAVEGRGAGWRQ